MADNDTDRLRQIQRVAADRIHPDCHTARERLTEQVPNIINEIDRLRAENQRLEEQHEAMADALVTEGVKLHYAKNEIESVLQLMDGLAEQWGDEAVFRRCRDRLRTLTKEAGE